MQRGPKQHRPAWVEDHSYLSSIVDLMSLLFFVFIIIMMAYAISTELNDTKDTTSSKEELEVTLRSINNLAKDLDKATNDLEKEVMSAFSFEPKVKKHTQPAMAAVDRIVNIKNNINAMAKIVVELKKTIRLSPPRAQEEAVQIRTDIIRKIKEKLEIQNIKPEIDWKKGIIRLGENMLTFEANKNSLDGNVKKKLNIIAEIFFDELVCYSGGERLNDCNDVHQPDVLHAVLLEGHADYRATSYKGGNLGLSIDRSVNAFQHMMASQPWLKELKNTEGDFLFGVSGYGDTRSLSGDKEKTKNLEELKKDRRIEFRFLLAGPNVRHTAPELAPLLRTDRSGF